MKELGFEKVLSFKLSDTGELDAVEKKTLLEQFQSIGVLVFYVFQTKRLYIWIGKSIPEGLKKYIPTIEHSLLAMNGTGKFDRNITILRHFTLEEGHERIDIVQDFYYDIGVQETDIKGQLKKWEDFEKSIIDQINAKQTEADKLVSATEFDKAIDATNEGIELAKTIKNDEIIRRKQIYIKDVKKKQILEKHQSGVKKELESLAAELEKTLAAEDVEKANDAANQMRRIYITVLKMEPISTHQELFTRTDALIEAWKEKQKSKEKDKQEKERAEKERIIREKLERDRLERDRLEKEQLEQERLEKERQEQERLEKERLEQERLEKERLEKERLEKERLEKERLEKERLEQERLEEERLKQERLEKERLEQERLGKERLEQERLEQERLEKERLEKERLEKERLEKERLEKERLEQERLEKERLEKERLEKERIEQERLEQERLEKERLEREALEKEEKDRPERERKKLKLDVTALTQQALAELEKGKIPTSLGTFNKIIQLLNKFN